MLSANGQVLACYFAGGVVALAAGVSDGFGVAGFVAFFLAGFFGGSVSSTMIFFGGAGGIAAWRVLT